MATSETSYLFRRNEYCIFVEIYFPKRAAYYGAVFNALRYGYDEKVVKKYLRDNAIALLEEFSAFPDLFNPGRYTATKSRKESVSLEEALERIAMYESFFKGWSTHTVDGVFFDSNDNPIEEATQVVRVIFRLKSSSIDLAKEAECEDVLRAILFWALSWRSRLQEHKMWSIAEQNQFIARHKPWPKKKLAFAKQHFQSIVREVVKWTDDSVFFVFCYLARKFWKNVIKEKLSEEEIWVTSLFNLGLNVVERIDHPSQSTS